jgi:N-acetylmuramoyl-L-alanine amidase
MPRLFGIIGVLLLSFFAHPSHTRADFTVAIDVGHSPDSAGALSARNRPEYSYNLKMAFTLLRELRKEPRIRPLILNPTGNKISLKQRVDLINGTAPDLLISIHHDSVQPFYLSKWKYRGTPAAYCDKFQGYSIFISERNAQPGMSRSYAIAIGNQLRKSGFFPTAHHAEKIKGEGRELIDRQAGVYRFDELLILKESRCPAVLLECGIIKNRAEEMLLRDPAYRKRLARAIRSAVGIVMDDRGRTPRT